MHGTIDHRLDWHDQGDTETLALQAQSTIDLLGEIA